MRQSDIFINGKPIKQRARTHAQIKASVLAAGRTRPRPPAFVPIPTDRWEPTPLAVKAEALEVAEANRIREMIAKAAIGTKPQPSRARLLEASSEKRKAYPITSGVLDYFPDAIAAVAEVSFQGNEKHNPGEPLHWARGKSMDHADCIARHLVERGGVDGNILHTAALAWRALALLQEELEKAHGLAPPRGASQI